MIKKSIISLGIVLGILSIFFGSYLPFIKARAYVRAIDTLNTIKDVSEFERVFGNVLSLFSPTGQEEIVKFMSSDVITSVVSQNNPEELSRELVSFIEPHLFKNDVRHLIIRGNLYSLLWQKYRQEDDFVKSEGAYRAALAIGPKLPPVLYSLLDLYRAKGDTEKLKEIGSTILKYWPSDQQVQNILDQLGSGQPSATAPVR